MEYKTKMWARKLIKCCKFTMACEILSGRSQQVNEILEVEEKESAPRSQREGPSRTSEREGKARGQGYLYRERKEGQRVSGLVPAGLFFPGM